jgi:hypothetical protein
LGGFVNEWKQGVKTVSSFRSQVSGGKTVPGSRRKTVPGFKFQVPGGKPPILWVCTLPIEALSLKGFNLGLVTCDLRPETWNRLYPGK